MHFKVREKGKVISKAFYSVLGVSKNGCKDILGMYLSESENALLKLIYCACQKVLEKWNQPMHNWALIVSQLQIYFDGRLNLGLR